MIGEIFIRRLAQIGDLSARDADALNSLEGRIEDVKRGQDLLRQGDRPSDSVAVISGLLQRYTTTPEGVRQIHSLYLPIDTPCLETIHIEVMDNNLGALAPSRVVKVPHSELFRVMRERPNLQALFWRETLVQASMFREWLMRNSRKLAHAQLAHFFCEMLFRARASGIADGYACDLPATQEDIADALGMTSVHVNRTLMMLRSAGLVELRGGRLEVRDWDELAMVAEFDPYYLHIKQAT